MPTRMLFIGFALLFTASHALASAQLGDNLIYNNTTNEIFTTPLESRFKKDDRPKVFDNSFPISSLTRGYLGTWKIENEHLYLVSLKQPTGTKDKDLLWKEIPLVDLFKDEEPIKAVWFSGILRIPQGKKLKYDLGFRSIHERTWMIQIDKGQVIKEWTVDNTKEEKKTNKQEDAKP